MSVEQATRIEQLITAAQFAELSDTPGRRYELACGKVVELPGTGYPHATIVKALFLMLNAFVTTHDLGEAYPDGLAYIVARAPDSVRIPDVSFIGKVRVPENGFPGYVPFAPDFAVEVVSPSDRAGDIHTKVYEYLRAGTRMVWVVWPESHSVSVYTELGASREYDAEDELDGTTVLPGFRVPVLQLFAGRTTR